MGKSKIEWTEKTWNPIVSGCSIISEGCQNCYAMKMAGRLEAMGQEKYKGLTRKTAKGKTIWNGKINIDLNDKALYEPLKTKKPTMYFVNSMTDLFHEDVPFEAIDKIMAVIALTPQHTYQVLTKRDERMKEYFDRANSTYKFNDGKEYYHRFHSIQKEIFDILFYKKIAHQEAVNNFTINLPYLLIGNLIISDRSNDKCKIMKSAYNGTIPVSDLGFHINITPIENNQYRHNKFFPMPNLWLGVSVENQETLSRIDNLRKTPAAVRFLSCEPLLQDLGTIDLKGIHWVIVGGESGHGARPMHPDWLRSIQQQCQSAGVPFFFKQMSSKDNKDYKNFEAFPKDLQVREMPKL